jgi:hypothetical protein
MRSPRIPILTVVGLALALAAPRATAPAPPTVPPVVAPPAVVAQPTTGAAPVYVLDPSRYASVDALFASGDVTQETDKATRPRITIVRDPTAPFGAAFQFQFRSGDPAEYALSLFSRRLSPATGVREIWTEAYIRFPSGWSTADATTKENPDQKLFFINTWPDNRFQIKQGTSLGDFLFARGPGWDDDYYRTRLLDATGTPIHAATDQWITLRAHAKLSSSASASDGEYEVWVNGALAYTAPKGATRSNNGASALTGIYGIEFGANHNRATGRDQFYRVGGGKLWTSNPGWQ